MCNVKGDGQIDLYNYHLDEHMTVTYKVNDSYNQEGLEKIFKILRSPDGKAYPISTQLIEIIDHIQDRLGIRTIEIISGYRSPEYNKGLKDNGKKVARESLHKLGKAIDIHIDEITEEGLRDFAEKLECGGVGYYPDYDFIHIDVGPIKRWGERAKKRKLVGIKNNKSKNKLITGKNDYLLNDVIQLELTNGLDQKIVIDRCLRLETFRRGKWIHLEDIYANLKGNNIEPGKKIILQLSATPKKCKSKKTIKLPFGKYRIWIEGSADKILSNEFYLKKF